MDAILNWGISLILCLQGLGEWLLAPMKLITNTGSEEFYLLLAPAILWCWDYTLGLKMGLGMMVNEGINAVFKLLLHGPRPFWYDSRVKAYVFESSFGVPSGHSERAVVVWGLLADGIKKRWAWIVAVALMLLMGFSRMYLGAHFPHDVLLGWLIGALILWAFLRFEGRLAAWLGKMKPQEQILVAISASLVLILLGVLANLTSINWVIPQAWVETAAAAFPEETIDPLALSGLISSAGAFFGLALGGIWIIPRGGFPSGGPAWQRLARYLVGLAGVVILWYGLGAFFPRGEYFVAYLLRYLRYTLVGFWISGAAPAMFIRVKLARLAD